MGRQGIRFTRFYSNAPECTPTRSALMSGQYQQRFGGLECAIGIGDVGRYDEAIWLQKRGELGLPPSAGTKTRVMERGGDEKANVSEMGIGALPKNFSPRPSFAQSYRGPGWQAAYLSPTTRPAPRP